MVGMMGSLVMESHACPCLCLDSVLTSASVKGNGDRSLCRSSMAKRNFPRTGSLELGSSFVDSWHDWRLQAKAFSVMADRRSSRNRRKDRGLAVVNELGGQYEDSFNDVKLQILNYFTYKAVRTVLSQLYEMNPTQYRWFYDFVATNNPGDGKRFLQKLGKERHDLAERVMVTRLHLYAKWIKKCDHAAIYKEISDENLELMRERLMDTVIWPTEDL